MTYIQFNTYCISDAVKEEAEKTSYRKLASKLTAHYGDYKISPSKLCRIANKKQSMTMEDAQRIVNYLQIPSSELITVFPF